jgi:hypothetical protein
MYNATTANDAAVAFAPGGTINSGTCGADACVENISGSHCVVWCYGGTLAGHERESGAGSCTCPTTGGGTRQ